MAISSVGLMPAAIARSTAALPGADRRRWDRPMVAVSTAPMMAPLVAALPRMASPFLAMKSLTAAVSWGLMPACIRARSICSPDSTAVLPAVAPAQPPSNMPPGTGLAAPAAPPTSMPAIGATMFGICSTIPPPMAERFLPVARRAPAVFGASCQSLVISPTTSLAPPSTPSPRSQACINSLPSGVPGLALR